MAWLLALSGAVSAVAADDAEAVLARFGVQVSASAVRQHALWHEPRKVLLLDCGSHRNGGEKLRPFLGGAELVVVHDTRAAIPAAVDVGVIIGANPEICDALIIDSAKQWKALRVVITPHIAGRSDFPDEARWTIPAANLRRYVAGERMLNMVDLQRGF